MVNSLEQACTRSAIKNAFAACNLVPLTEDPPYTREEDDDLVRQAEKAGIPLPKETARKKEHITDILTCDSAIEKI